MTANMKGRNFKILLYSGGFFLCMALLFFWPSLVWGDEAGLKGPGADLAATVNKVQKAVASLRGLEFRSPIFTETMSINEFRDYFLKRLAEEMPDEEIRAMRKTLVKFGLIPAGLDLKETLVELFVQNVGGFYDPQKKKLVLVGEAPYVYQGIWAEVLLAHEFTHALTDQHFDLEKFLPPKRGDDDLALARQAVGEGDATLIMFEYMLRGWEKDAGQLPGLLTMLEFSAAIPPSATLKRLPLVIRENLLFPYVRGYDFVRHIKEKDGWEAVNRLYQTPPSSTEEILHPDKFLSGGERGVKLTLPDLDKILGEIYQPLDRNTLGELNLAVVLIEFLGAEETSRAAVGWAGDEYASYEADADGRILLIWLTLWDTPEDAHEFCSAYEHLVANKYRREKEENFEPEEEGTKVRLWQTEKDLILVEKRGKFVVIVEGLERALLQRLREALWDGMDRGEKIDQGRQTREGLK